MTIAGYFRWTRGLKGPCPQKVDVDFAQVATDRMIAQVALTPAQCALPLDKLALAYDHLKGETL